MAKTLNPVLIGIFFLLILTSCSTLPPGSSEQIPWKHRQSLLNRIQNWQLQGKIAAQTNRDSGSATVNWIQHQNQFTISLLGPLGTSGLKLMGKPGLVVLQTPEGKSYTANTPEQLLAQQWGFNVPVSYLNYWVRGLPVPGIEAHTQFDAYGRLNNLVQQGWQVQFLSYMHTGNVEVPSRMTIISSMLKVKIIIYQWRVS